MSFCLPVKKGWQLEQISRRRSSFLVERVVQVAPQAQWTFRTAYTGWIPAFMTLPHGGSQHHPQTQSVTEVARPDKAGRAYEAQPTPQARRPWWMLAPITSDVD